MRMRELAEASGLPRSTIHHYLREGLLPPPVKTARNAAVYDERHLERLRLIGSLRGGALGMHPLETVRAVLALVERGLSPEMALTLRSLPADAGAPRHARLSAAELFAAAGVEAERGGALLSAGLLVPGDASATPFGPEDVAMARAYAALFEATGLAPADLAPVADLLREVSGYERALGELVGARETDPNGEARRSLARTLTAMHTYLFVRGAGAESPPPA